MRRARRVTQADYHAAGRALRADMTLADAKWSEPKYPGDAVRCTMLQRDNELGDVRIQHYGVGCYMVAAYLPGYETSSPGDTPKMNPDKHQWVETAEGANGWFEQYVRGAMREGWSPYNPNTVTVEWPL